MLAHSDIRSAVVSHVCHVCVLLLAVDGLASISSVSLQLPGEYFDMIRPHLFQDPNAM